MCRCHTGMVTGEDVSRRTQTCRVNDEQTEHHCAGHAAPVGGRWRNGSHGLLGFVFVGGISVKASPASVERVREKRWWHARAVGAGRDYLCGVDGDAVVVLLR